MPAKTLRALESEAYLPADAAVHRQVLEQRLRELTAQWVTQNLSLRTQESLLKRASDRLLRAMKYNPGVNEQIAPQTKTQLAQLMMNMETLEAEIEIVQDDLAVLDKAAPAAEAPSA